MREFLSLATLVIDVDIATGTKADNENEAMEINLFACQWKVQLELHESIQAERVLCPSV